ncbi:MAG: nicotinate phosphoribosyltransferase [Campylobacter sp.]|nr:nicotinate phosphoribosyltransferase [Campylobacter sp.]
MKNLALFTDYYQLSMMQGYFLKNKDEVAVFDMYFRKHPSGGAYAILCGINELVEYIQNLKFTDLDIEYLSSLGSFKDEFLDYLREFKFSGEIYAIDEGSVVFAHEPLIRVRANLMQAGLIEAALLNIISFQTLIATKASRITDSAGNAPVMEFGARRAQGMSASIYGAKAAIVGGCVGTSNVAAAMKFNLKPLGTHSHAWVQSFASELEAFRAYARAYPNETLLLVDTYDTLKSGLPNAITVFRELRAKGFEPLGIRIDSGDLEYLTKAARKMLDDAGFKNAKITASNDLDEYLVEHLKSMGAKIDSFGIGTKLITSDDTPSLGGVYKLSGIQNAGKIIPKIKISNDPRKINNPGLKQVFRLYDKTTHKAMCDLITLDGESIDESKPLEIFHPLYTYKRQTITNFYTKKLLKPLFVDGEFVGEKKSVECIAKFAKQEKQSMWDEYLRINKPPTYKVDLSLRLWNIREELLENFKGAKSE